MYVNPFWAGVVVTLVSVMGLAFVASVYCYIKDEKNKK